MQKFNSPFNLRLKKVLALALKNFHVLGLEKKVLASWAWPRKLSPWKQDWFTCHLFFEVEAKNLPSRNWDLSVVNVLLWRGVQQKLYRQDFRDVDRLKYVLLLLGPISQDALKGYQT